MAKWTWKSDEVCMADQDVDVNKWSSKLERIREPEGRSETCCMRKEHLSSAQGFHLAPQLNVALDFSLHSVLYYT